MKKVPVSSKSEKLILGIQQNWRKLTSMLWSPREEEARKLRKAMINKKLHLLRHINSQVVQSSHATNRVHEICKELALLSYIFITVAQGFTLFPPSGSTP